MDLCRLNHNGLALWLGVILLMVTNTPFSVELIELEPVHMSDDVKADSYFEISDHYHQLARFKDRVLFYEMNTSEISTRKLPSLKKYHQVTINKTLLGARLVDDHVIIFYETGFEILDTNLKTVKWVNYPEGIVFDSQEVRDKDLGVTRSVNMVLIKQFLWHKNSNSWHKIQKLGGVSPIIQAGHEVMVVGDYRAKNLVVVSPTLENNIDVMEKRVRLESLNLSPDDQYVLFVKQTFWSGKGKTCLLEIKSGDLKCAKGGIAAVSWKQNRYLSHDDKDSWYLKDINTHKIIAKKKWRDQPRFIFMEDAHVIMAVNVTKNVLSLLDIDNLEILKEARISQIDQSFDVGLGEQGITVSEEKSMFWLNSGKKSMVPFHLRSDNEMSL